LQQKLLTLSISPTKIIHDSAKIEPIISKETKKALKVEKCRW